MTRNRVTARQYYNRDNRQHPWLLSRLRLSQKQPRFISKTAQAKTNKQEKIKGSREKSELHCQDQKNEKI